MAVLMLQGLFALVLPIRLHIPMALIEDFSVLFEDTLPGILSGLWSHLDGSHEVVLVFDVILIFLGDVLHEPIELGVNKSLAKVDFAGFFIDDLTGNLLYLFLAHSKS